MTRPKKKCYYHFNRTRDSFTALLVRTRWRKVF